MSYIDGEKAPDWIEKNHPENGLFRVYWKDGPGGRFGDVVNLHEGGATLDPDEGGELRYEWSYKDGERADGVSKSWYVDGTLKQIKTWKNGKEDGLSTVWDEIGQKNYEINYNDGNKWKISNYKNDKLDGTYVEYHKNGNKKKEVTFKDWKDISEKYYDTSGIALEV